MKKLYLTFICAALAAVMLFSACADKDNAAPSESINPSDGVSVTDAKQDDKKNTGTYNVATDFKRRCDSGNATIEEVEELIAFSKEVYSKYDTVIVNETTTFKTVDAQGLTVDKIDKLDVEDPQIVNFEKSLSESKAIFIEMLSLYLPEGNVLIMDGKTSSGMIPDYYFLNIKEKGFKNSKEAYDKIFDDGTSDFDKVADCVYVLRGTIFFYDSETDENKQIFLTSEEEAMSAFINDKRSSKDKDPEYYIKLHGLDAQ